MEENISNWSNLLQHSQSSFESFELAAFLLYPGFLLAIPIAAVAGLFSLFRSGARISDGANLFGAIFVLSFVAYITGFVSTNSRETVIGEIVPALLGGFGALLLYTYINGKIHRYAAGVSAIGFSVALFFGLVSGAHFRENVYNLGDGATNFAVVGSSADEVSSHRSDAVAYKTVLDFLLLGEETTTANVAKARSRLELYAVPRRNYHFEKAFTNIEIDRYQDILQSNPGLDMKMIKEMFEGEERVLISEIHFALNPLEELTQ